MSDDNNTPAAAAAAAAEQTANNSTVPKNAHPDPFRVQVKSEYLVTERPSILAPIPEKSVDTTTTSTHETNTNNNSKGKKKRGQNKKRPRDARISTSDKACLAIIRGETCPFENCKYNHDLKEMMANRQLDLCEGEEGVEWLAGECPNWKLMG